MKTVLFGLQKNLAASDPEPPWPDSELISWADFCKKLNTETWSVQKSGVMWGGTLVAEVTIPWEEKSKSSFNRLIFQIDLEHQPPSKETGHQQSTPVPGPQGRFSKCSLPHVVTFCRAQPTGDREDRIEVRKHRIVYGFSSWVIGVQVEFRYYPLRHRGHKVWEQL